jgi:hypothetical protein
LLHDQCLDRQPQFGLLLNAVVYGVYSFSFQLFACEM